MTERERRPSFGDMLLRRSKSSDLVRGSKKERAALREAELERQRQASRIPPKLPEFANHTEQLSKSFGKDLDPALSDGQFVKQTDSYYGRPSIDPSIASTHARENAFDPYARTESMTHRGRYSYASSAVSTINSPRRVRRRKDPTPFNVLVIGTRNAGKTSFLEFLKSALALPPKKRAKKPEDDEFDLPAPTNGNFIPHYVETEMDNERIGLTLWDSEGLEKNVVDMQLREMSAFLESKFEETFAEEMKVVRSPGVQDTHIHAAFLILDPARLDRNIAAGRNLSANGNGRHNGHGHSAGGIRAFGGLDEDLDMQVLRLLQRKTTIIPVISKADTITTKHMNVLKKTVWETLKKANMDPLETLGLDDNSDTDKIDEEEEEDEDEEVGAEFVPVKSSKEDAVGEGSPSRDRLSPSSSPNSKRLSSHSIRRHRAQQESKEEAKEDETPFLPLSIISPDLYEPDIVGRQFPWGFADPYNEEHCDFTRLKEAVFSEWRSELRVASREQWYEGWRTNRLKQRGGPNRRR